MVQCMCIASDGLCFASDLSRCYGTTACFTAVYNRTESPQEMGDIDRADDRRAGNGSTLLLALPDTGRRGIIGTTAANHHARALTRRYLWLRSITPNGLYLA
jgi:hypothetical protein